MLFDILSDHGRSADLLLAIEQGGYKPKTGYEYSEETTLTDGTSANHDLFPCEKMGVGSCVIAPAGGSKQQVVRRSVNPDQAAVKTISECIALEQFS